MNVSNITPQLTELMVLGVGVDYALFIVTRHRRNLRRGMSVPDSIVAAINTSGRAVLFAGTTVCIAMLGLIALGVSFFYGMAVGTAIAVGLTMARLADLAAGAAAACSACEVLPPQAAPSRAGRQFIDVQPTGFWARWSRRSSPAPGRVRPCRPRSSYALAIPFSRCDSARPTRATTRRHHDAQGLRPDRPGFRRRVTTRPDARGRRPGKRRAACLQTVGQALAGVTERRPAQRASVPTRRLTRAAVTRVVQVDHLATG